MKNVDLLYLSQKDVMCLNIGWEQIIERIELALKEHTNQTVENPPKRGVHSRDNTFIHEMPVYLKEMDAVGIKWVSGYPENYKHGLPQILGMQIINCPKTGAPLCIMDCTWITAVRTSAVSAITAKHFARRDSKKVAIIGAGVQGRYHLDAFKYILPNLSECSVYDIKEEAMDNFIDKMGKKVDVKINKAESIKDAVYDADIILTATQRTPRHLIEDEWLKKGALGIGLEVARAWDPRTVIGCDKFITDDTEQTLSFKAVFEKGIPNIYAEIGEIILGKKEGRTSDEERVLAVNVGLACEDISLGKYVYDTAVDKNIGTRLDLMTEEL